ncbi:type I-E CRISPR-associated protein Cas6/Cse3/CasE [Slackia exigua]|uniref:CRISPR system CASCADE complex protein CasE n=1 Tax=Slackia exigua (strain ATCC 700122 / DSM 15923 / CIP 105133 / JCM 11022 / KCTC 5966 / S-7) TaxID=649764 RepID=D0WFC7_SLAES|nr:type I-E CRISPR-associated protein Cas6/Cse3/CasE [Slackia exigua]EEZ61811.1 CRISPR system CASCADE complex protein CasE [Slackia exigua ATCC 700122]STN98798.1 CRISPR-associated protein Cas6/Cse3/CasE, subtype I-E/ECOLI [Slackia exigua]
MTYLTRFPINKTRRDARRLLASPYQMHAAIAGSFPVIHCLDSGKKRVLWRVDASEDGSARLYIVSPDKPSLVGLDEQIGWPDLPQQWETRSYDTFLSRIEIGQEYAFRLFANPVLSRSTRGGRTVPRNEKGKPKRIGHLTVLQQAAWLIGKDAYLGSGLEVPELFAHQEWNRAQRNGFEVLTNLDGTARLIVSHSGKQKLRSGRESCPITLSTAQFDGFLRVSDPDLLRSALVNGIGHAKGFGCGLLTLAPMVVR